MKKILIVTSTNNKFFEVELTDREKKKEKKKSH